MTSLREAQEETDRIIRARKDLGTAGELPGLWLDNSVYLLDFIDTYGTFSHHFFETMRAAELSARAARRGVILVE